ncbi:hypothetical protein, partial [Phycicoccus sp. Root563]|uniref:hypothetical protein n=1 Tax=Phycicoccus sp. Root563 TaxID=1736562 RepID=UPI000702EE54
GAGGHDLLDRGVVLVVVAQDETDVLGGTNVRDFSSRTARRGCFGLECPRGPFCLVRDSR